MKAVRLFVLRKKDRPLIHACFLPPRKIAREDERCVNSWSGLNLQPPTFDSAAPAVEKGGTFQATKSRVRA